jgi:branched-chain amino acid transport system substrate-binding protein
VTLKFTEDNPWTFTMGAPASIVGEGICETVVQLGPKTVATVTTSSNAGQVEFGEETMKCLEGEGVKSLDDETVTDQTTNFGSVITNMKSANPEAILVFLNGGSSAQFVTQARSAGIPDSVTFIGPETMTGAEFLEVGGKAANGSIGVAAYALNSTNPPNKPFVEAYEARFNEPPEVFSAQGYAAMQLLIAGLEAAGKEADKQKIVEGMEAVENSPTILGEGKLTISEAHLPEYGHVVVEAQNEKLKILELGSE